MVLLSRILTIYSMLSVVVWNTRRIISSVACLSERNSHCDIAEICEHKLFQQSLNIIDCNYTPFASADTSIKLETCRCDKGGVAIIYRNNLKFHCDQPDCYHSEKIIGIELKTNTNKFI